MPAVGFSQTYSDNEFRSNWWIPIRLSLLIVFGLYLTLRGYHSRDGDQAYRLPIYLHQQNTAVYQNDPFVRAFDQFNPHQGAFLVLKMFSWPAGLSVGLFALFTLTFLITFVGVDRLTRATWPNSARSIGLMAFILFLIAKAGNIGTNHLFESMLLDRLQAFALGWVAIASAVGALGMRRHWIAPTALGVATVIHPSAGLQLVMSLSVGWILWAILGHLTNVRFREAIGQAGLLVVSALPGLWLNAGEPGALLRGLSPDEYWTLAVELQSPQHMLPHLWRMPQWLAWASYIVLAMVALSEASRSDGSEDQSTTRYARNRLVLVLVAILVGLGAAWVGIEVLHDVRITVFQPYRMATIARGLAIVFISHHILTLWRRRDTAARLRAALLILGLVGDWLMVVVTSMEVAAWGLERFGGRIRTFRADRLSLLSMTFVLGLGFRFLSRHDTESGHIPLLVVLVLIVLIGLTRSWSRLEAIAKKWCGSQRRAGVLAVASWTLPVLAIVAGQIPTGHPLAERREIRSLINRCRFGETPADDVERLAAWCRHNTPENARFVGPPGPKTFRLWSRRSLAFNRASSPYHAEGLADWFSRFRDHVNLTGSPDEFVQRYIRDRHGVESRFQAMSPSSRIELALRQGASHIIAAAPDDEKALDSRIPLELLHKEGRYAVYQLKTDQLAGTIPGAHLQR